MRQNHKKPAALPRLAEPEIGDRIATRFDGSIRYGRVMAKFLHVFHVEFEDEAVKVRYKLQQNELWKVRNANPS